MRVTASMVKGLKSVMTSVIEERTEGLSIKNMETGRSRLSRESSLLAVGRLAQGHPSDSTPEGPQRTNTGNSR